MTNPIDQIEAFVIDFDGVLTNNLVHVDQDGKETVSCSRSDGLAFDALKKLNKNCYIVSTEENSVVSIRAKKLKVPVIQGVVDKAEAVKELTIKYNYNLKNILYVGNDLNDYYAMKICGYSACPADSHLRIKEISKITLSINGGHGVIRCLLEDFLNIDLIKVLYKN